MKLTAIALDYDGTIAVDGVLDAGVRDAIADARQRGIVIVVATGRQIEDLRRVVGDLACFDVVVGENGAVLHFPTKGGHVVLGRPPDPTLLDELRRQDIPFTVGEIVVETDARFAAATLEVLRRLEQPLILAFNRGRLMLLPQAISKSTGLRQALSALRLSIHNTIGVGDAENDHDLLDACEVGVAVAWGSPALCAVADEVIDGTSPAAVGEYLRRVSRQLRLSTAQIGRRRLVLGRQHDGEPVTLAVRGRTILIGGEPGTGKSWLAGLLCEQLILQGYCMCIIDPEGDYRSLEVLPSVIALGGDDPAPSARELSRALRHPDVSVLVDLSKVSRHHKIEYLNTLFPALNTCRRHTGLPHQILLDEAHCYLGGPDAGSLVDPELASYILISDRISGLASSVRMTSEAVILVTRETDLTEIEGLQRICQLEALDPNILRDLAINEAALLPGKEESHGEVRRFQLAPRVSIRARYAT